MLPKLFEGFRADEKTVGIMLSITTVSTLTTAYYAGHLSDKLGRVTTLGFACLTIALSLFLYGISQSVGLTLTMASICLGAGWGLTYSLAPVAMTKLVAPDERVKCFALLSVFVMAGFGLSPVMTAMLQDRGFSVADAFYLTAAFCTISGAIFFILVKPMRAHALISGAEPQSRLTLSSVKLVLKSRALVPVTMVCLGASVFAGLNNFQTVIAESRGLDYAPYFLTYTITVIVLRVLLANSKGGTSPYLTIAILQYIMCGSVALYIVIGGNQALYKVVALLFALGYGVSYPNLVAMAAKDADDDLVPQTLQLFALTYFIGIFGFPLIAGWIIVEFGAAPLLTLVALLAAIEASMAAYRAIRNKIEG
jgi:MFS family permease